MLVLHRFPITRDHGDHVRSQRLLMPPKAFPRVTGLFNPAKPVAELTSVSSLLTPEIPSEWPTLSHTRIIVGALCLDVYDASTRQPGNLHCQSSVVVKSFF